jgi:hypothetical protein
MLRPAIRWRLLFDTWRQNPGNMLVHCGVITVGLFFGLVGLGGRFHISENAFLAGLVVVLIFAFATLLFGCLRVVNYFRRRRSEEG